MLNGPVPFNWLGRRGRHQIPLDREVSRAVSSEMV